jgi:nucleoside-diphosphate-sugar epimerase
VADAYARAVLSDVRGAFNVAAEPVIDADGLARLLHARTVPMSSSVARAAVAVSWQLHLQPMPPGWVDLALAVPLMDCSRAERELGWHATRTAEEALLELLDGLRERAGAPTPPLAPDAGGPKRTGELASGVGSRQ